MWIGTDAREAALNAGALVFDPISVIGSHLAEIARVNAAELVGRQELQTLLEHLRATVPAVVKEIGTEATAVRRRCIAPSRCCCAKAAWPRDTITVLEAMLEAGTADPRELAEAARRAIVPDLIRRRAVAQLEPAIFDPEFERLLAASWTQYGAATAAPVTALGLRDRIARYAARTPRDRAAVVCTAVLRPLLADFLLRSGVRLPVYAYGELPNEIALVPAEVIAADEPNALAQCT